MTICISELAVLAVHAEAPLLGPGGSVDLLETWKLFMSAHIVNKIILAIPRKCVVKI